MRLPVPHHHQPNSGSLTARAWVWLHQFELDRQLADGADPAGSAALAARSRAIVSRRFRSELVAHLESVLAKAEHPPHWHSASLPVCAHQVLAAREPLGELARALQSDGDAAVRGVALAACLINDPRGPLYHRGVGDEISVLAQAATAALCLPVTRPDA